MGIQFVEENGTYTGIGPGGRHWKITPVFTGWRLEFRDEGSLRTPACTEVSKRPRPKPRSRLSGLSFAVHGPTTMGFPRLLARGCPPRATAARNACPGENFIEADGTTLQLIAALVRSKARGFASQPAASIGVRGRQGESETSLIKE